jgi:hypothetical protein
MSELRSVLFKSQAYRTEIAAEVYAKLGNTTAWESRASEGSLFAGAMPSTVNLVAETPSLQMKKEAN